MIDNVSGEGTPEALEGQGATKDTRRRKGRHRWGNNKVWPTLRGSNCPAIDAGTAVMAILLSGLKNVHCLSCCFQWIDGRVLEELKWQCCFSTGMHVLTSRFAKVIYFSLSLKGKLIQFTGTYHNSFLQTQDSVQLPYLDKECLCKSICLARQVCLLLKHTLVHYWHA